MPAGRFSRHLPLILKVGIAVGLTAYIVWLSDPSEVLAAIARPDWRWLALAVALVIADRALMAWRWMTLLDDAGGPLPPPSRLLRIFFVSTFFGTFLPGGGVSADAVRALSLSRENVQGSRALASVMMDRLLGTIGLVLLAAVGLFIAASVAPFEVLALAIAAAAGACAAASSLIYSRTLEALLQRLALRLPPRLATPVSRLLLALRAYSSRHGALLTVLAASVLVNALRVMQGYVLGLSLGLDAPFVAYAAFIPIIVLIMQLPVSIYGLGTTQAAFVGFFGGLGMSDPEAVALSGLFLALGLVGALPGGLIYLLEPRRGAPAGRVL